MLEILKRAWTQERFSFDGQFYHFHNVCLVPKPYQKPYPEIRIAVNSPDTYPAERRRRACRSSVATRLGDLIELGPNLRAYREGWAAAGHPGNGKVYLRVPVYVAATEQQRAVRAGRERDVLLPLSRRSASRSLPAWKVPARSRTAPSAASGCRHITYEEVLRSKIIVGTPRMVADRLRRAAGGAGPCGILAEMNCGMRIPHQQVLNSLQLMCEDVIPHFRG